MHSYTSYHVRRREDRLYSGERKGWWVVLSLIPIWEVCVKRGSVTKHHAGIDPRQKGGLKGTVGKEGEGSRGHMIVSAGLVFILKERLWSPSS